MPQNELYLAVMPLVRVPRGGSLHKALGNVLPTPVEQYITLFPDRNFATEFFADEVEFYIDALKSHLPQLTGGHVTGYEFFPQKVEGDRVIVMVVQYVS